MRISTLFAILALEATAIKIELLGEYEELDKETSDAVDAAVACTEEHGASMTAWWNYLRKWDGPLSLDYMNDFSYHRLYIYIMITIQ